MRFYLSLVSPLLLPLLLILSSCSSGGGGGSDDTSNASNPLPLPFLSSLFPERGPVAGGTFVTVSGSNFLGTTQVRLGGISLSSFAVVSSSSLTFTVPSGSVGFAELEVVNAFGSSNPTTPLGFTRTTESWRLLSSSVPSPSPRFYSKAVYDSTRQRMLVFGGEFFDSVTFDSAVFGEVWALDLRNANLSSAIWTLLTPAVNATGFPTAFTEMALVYDSVRDRVLMTQGLRGDFTPLGAAVFALTFSSTAFNESGTWTRLSDIGSETPPARFTPGVAFSSTGDRLILLGGFDANFAGGTNGAGQFNDTWAFNLEGNSSGFWENLTPAVGTVPLAEAGADPAMASITYPSLIFDGRNQRIVSFGGFTDTNPAFGMGELTLDETYQLRLVPALSLWEFFPLIGGMRPIPSNGHHGVYDGLNQRFVVHGGFRGFGTGPSGETWALDLSGVRQTWVPLATQGGASGPVRENHVMVYDSQWNRFILFGGANVESTPSNFSEVWVLEQD